MKLGSILTALVFFFYCCKQKGGDGGTAHLAVPLHFVDSSGNDLFSSFNDGQNSYWMDSVKVSNIDQGNQYATLNCFDEHTVGYQFEMLAEFVMKVCPNYNVENSYTYTLIHLKNGMDDTLKIHINQNIITPSTMSDSFWYNGILQSFDSNAAITIVR